MPFLPALLLLFADETGEPIDAALKRFAQAFAVVTENAAEPVNTAQAVYEGAIPGMLKRLDPHSVFFDPAQFDQLKELEKSTRKGFGTIVSVLPGRVIVLQTMPGTPSEKAGMIPGDEIVAVNGYRLDRLEAEQIVQLLGASRQQKASLEIRRPGSVRLLQLSLTPEDVDAPSVDRAFFLEPGVAYVRVTMFDVPTGKQIAEAIEKLGGHQLKGLVLDLRNNPGGVLPSALETASLFLKPGQLILSVKGRSVEGREVTVPENAKPYSFPLAVLVNGKSASASEIVAGAVQDHKRGAVIGENTFGKGLVQSVYPLSEGTGMALTTAFYHTPAGRNLQRPLPGALAKSTEQLAGGITPDEIVQPESMTRLRAVLDASGSFPSFATSFLQRQGKIAGDFQVSNQLLDDFQTFLIDRRIQPSLLEWSSEREWIRNRLTQEILNQGIGVEKGDEVEARRDPLIGAALRFISAAR